MQIGIQVGAAPDDGSKLADYVALSGRRPAMVMWFQSFGEPLYWPRQLPAVDAVHALPLITWDPVLASGRGASLRAIAAGSYDPYLIQSAALARAYGKPLLIRFAHEMNLPSAPYGPGHAGDSSSAFVAAWRHVVTVFRQHRAVNVLWVWSPNVEGGGKFPFTNLYPGDAYVDWVGLDGYNSDRPWTTLTQLFRRSHDELRALTAKPMMIAETASTQVGGSKASWILDAFLKELPTQFPDVRAVVWFDRSKESDWRVNSSAASLAAWRTVVANPRYTPVG